MKQIALFFILATVLFASTDKKILQEYANGIWTGSGLPEPKTIVDCADDKTAENVVLYIPDLFRDCSKAKNIWDFQKIARNAAKFAKSIPKNVTDCLMNNPEAEALCNAYDCLSIDYKKVIAYFTFHAKQAANQCKVIYTAWKQSNYTEAGSQTAVFVKNILQKSNSLQQLGTNKEILQEVLNGVFEDSQLPDPTTVMDCMDENVATNIVLYVPTPVKACAKAKSILDFKNIAQDAQKFAKSIPQAVIDCLSNNKELNNLCDKYDCKNISITHVISYLTFHTKKVAGQCGNLETLWEQGKFKDFGTQTTEMVKSIIKQVIIMHLQQQIELLDEIEALNKL